MIKYIVVTNYLGESKTVILSEPEKSGMIIKNIDGLGAPKADINITEMATKDGGFFNSARAQNRNIVFEFELIEVPTVEDVRQETYKYFPIKQKVSILFKTDNRECIAYGYVESNEPDIFSQKETVKISVICDDPYFYSTFTNSTIFYGIEPRFEFIFSNESLTEPLLEFSEIRREFEQTVTYSGDAEIGVKITIHANGPAKNINIYKLSTREQFHIDTDKLVSLTGSGIITGDTINISTIKGDKYIELLRNGRSINILNCVDKSADWFTLSKGDNIFAYTAGEGMENLEFSMENRSVFEGI